MTNTRHIKTVSVEEFHAELKAQGLTREHLAFRCPMCGTIQSAADLIAVGAGANFNSVSKYLGFSCVGRWTHGKPPPTTKGTQKGCNWTLGGLLSLHDYQVVDEDGKIRPHFAPATRDELPWIL